jgi:phosphomethylpyrimidine synthase
MYGPKFCSMKITQDVRDYAATLNDQQVGVTPMSGSSGSWEERCMWNPAEVNESNKTL